ncbi:hypothetical protein K4A83_20055 [Spirulina subsalsa FACHB-351]|uniref:Uncharacterized protein n=1 Tax=Spirulina subsalsa FACHB-351 TaxID=234711 RepID=A0ABT3LAN9_9CYAN|nr:hypothetical protein [Spirulina subsalsa]MCW6038550.1 hypothetical protein [Spirulina subsalsa FACHB-351]
MKLQVSPLLIALLSTKVGALMLTPVQVGAMLPQETSVNRAESSVTIEVTRIAGDSPSQFQTQRQFQAQRQRRGDRDYDYNRDFDTNQDYDGGPRRRRR